VNCKVSPGGSEENNSFRIPGTETESRVWAAELEKVALRIDRSALRDSDRGEYCLQRAALYDTCLAKEGSEFEHYLTVQLEYFSCALFTM
jgi:hypothetical protein